MGIFTNFLARLKKSKKIVRMTVVGDGAVGKTTLVRALLRKTTNHTKNHSGDKVLEDKKVSRTPFMEIESWVYRDLIFQCYDLAGQRTPGAHPIDILQEQVINLIDIYVFVFSVDRYESFENLHEWMQLMDFENKIKNENIGFILVGNKIDLEGNVSKELIQNLVGNNKFFRSYVETCSLDGRGVDTLLDEITILGKKLLN